MFDKKEDKQRTLQWLNKLNAHNEGWYLGDENKDSSLKSADFINDYFHVVIELKREKGELLDNKDGNLVGLSNRLEEYFSDGNEKFKSYPSHKSMLLIELKSFSMIAKLAMEGIKSLHFQNSNLVGTSIKNKNLFSNMEHTGAVVFWCTNKLENIAYYFENPFSKPTIKISQKEAEELIGSPLNLLELNNGQ